MLIKSLQTAIVVYVVLAFFKLVRATARAPALRDPETGELVLQFSKFLTWTMGGIAVLGPLAMVILSFVIPFKNEHEVFIPIVMGLFFGLLGGSLCMYLSRRRTRLSRAGLTSEYVFRGPVHIPWEEVDSIKFTLNRQELFLYDRSGRKARIHIWHVGVKESAPLLRECLPEAVQRNHEKALSGFYEVIRA